MTQTGHRPRVLICMHSFESGGVERDIMRLAPSWRAAGIDAAIALGRREGVLVGEAPDVPYFQMQRGNFSTARFETLWMIAKLPGVIRRFRPDILYCAGNTYAIVAVAMRLIMGRSCPRIVLKISNDLRRQDLPAPLRWAYHLWLRLQRGAIDVAVAMAEPARDEIVQMMHLPPERIRVIGNASLDMHELHEFRTARDTAERIHQGRRFLAVGRLAPQKNFSLLIRAFARVARRDDILTIIGDGVERSRLEDLARSLDVERQVDFRGHLSTPLFDAFANADALVLSSDYEGLGVVVTEALAAGLPVVATDCCVNMRELVDGAGILVPIQDVAALAAAMDSIADTAFDVARMRARAATFTTEANAASWSLLFQKLAT